MTTELSDFESFTAKNNSLEEGASVVELDNTSKVKQYFDAHFNTNLFHPQNNSTLSHVEKVMKGTAGKINECTVRLSNGYIVVLSCWTTQGIWKVVVLPNNQNKERRSFADVMTDCTVSLNDYEEREGEKPSEEIKKVMQERVEKDRMKIVIIEELTKYIIKPAETKDPVTITIQKKPFEMSFSTKEGPILSNFNFNFMHPYEKNITPIVDSLFAKSDKDSPFTRFASKFNFDFPKDSNVYGLGEKLKSVDGFGLKRFGPSDKEDEESRVDYEFWNCDAYGHNKTSDPLYHTIPFALYCPSKPESSNFFGFFFDNVGYQKWSFQNQQKSSKGEIITEFEPLRFFVFAEKSPQKVVQQYLRITGLPATIPPLYVLGYQQCRWSYFPESRVKEIATKMREHKIPCDAIYFDIDYMNEFKCFTWGPDKFPDPKELVSNFLFKEKKMRSIVIIDPGLSATKSEKIHDFASEECEKNKFYCEKPIIDEKTGKLIKFEPYTNVVWPGNCYFPDYSSKNCRKWWGGLYDSLVNEVGVAGIWNDMNEPSTFKGGLLRTLDDETMHSMDEDREIFEGKEVIKSKSAHAAFHRNVHNMYGGSMVRASCNGLMKLRKNVRPFVLTRSGCAGAHRYCCTWTGDNSSDFEDLNNSIPLILSLGLGGLFFTGSDVGGFRSNCYDELFARWIAMSSLLYPICRCHAMQGTIDQEPWAFSNEVLEISKKFINLRYNLMPFLYSYAAFVSGQQGVPLTQPLWFNFPKDSECYKGKWETSEVIMAEKLLVAPILERYAVKRQVYFPKTKNGEKWIDFYDVFEGKPEAEWTIYESGNVYDIEAGLNHVPMFILEGSIIPIQRNVKENAYETLLHNEREVEYLVVPFNGQANGFHYLDDGETRNYEKGNFGCYALSINDGKVEKTLFEGKEDFLN